MADRQGAGIPHGKLLEVISEEDRGLSPVLLFTNALLIAVPAIGATESVINSFLYGKRIKLSWGLYLSNIVLSVHGKVINFGFASIFIPTDIALDTRKFNHGMVFYNGNPEAVSYLARHFGKLCIRDEQREGAL